MSRRRYADYLRGTGEGTDPPKPTAQGSQPSRAWLERDDDEPASEGAWRMTVEHRMQHATNHAGSFADLVSLAAESGVTEYYVWSSEANDFILCSREPPPTNAMRPRPLNQEPGKGC